MEKTLYIVRHGETDFNRQNIVQGSGVDSSLNILGQTQAQHFYQAYKDFPFQKIYISKLKRTEESVASFIKENIPFEKLEGLNEISWGKYEGKSHTQEFEQEYQQRVIDWKNGLWDLPISEGETPLQLHLRQKEALQYILSKPEEKHVLICMHGRALKAFICLLLNIPLSHMDDYEHRNLGLYVFEWKDGGFNMLVKNDAKHLAGVDVVNDLT